MLVGPLNFFRCLTWCHSSACKVQFGTEHSSSCADAIATKVVGIGTPSTFTNIFDNVPFLNTIFLSLSGLKSVLVFPEIRHVTLSSFPYLFLAHETDLFLCLWVIVNIALCFMAVQNLSSTDFWVEAE